MKKIVIFLVIVFAVFLSSCNTSDNKNEVKEKVEEIVEEKPEIKEDVILQASYANYLNIKDSIDHVSPDGVISSSSWSNNRYSSQDKYEAFTISQGCVEIFSTNRRCNKDNSVIGQQEMFINKRKIAFSDYEIFNGVKYEKIFFCDGYIEKAITLKDSLVEEVAFIFDLKNLSKAQSEVIYICRSKLDDDNGRSYKFVVKDFIDYFKGNLENGETLTFKVLSTDVLKSAQEKRLYIEEREKYSVLN